MIAGGEIRAALSESRRLFLSVGFFSVFVNLLMLTGPIFMLQVYDRVLTSRSQATLLTLAGITAFLFLMMGILDHARGRVLARAGARFQARLDARVLRAVLTRAVSPAERTRPATGLRDLDAIQRFASGNAPFAFFDAPWTPVFLCALFLFHWTLGLLAVLSGCLLLLIALANQARTGRLQGDLGEATARSAHFVEQMRAGSETVRGLGMQDAVVARSGALRDEILERAMAASDRSGFFGVTTRTLRLFLQSMMLGLGAWLAIRGQATFGVIIAASILLGRALAPIDQAVGQWPLLQRVVAARRALAQLLEETPPEASRTALPRPRAILDVQGVTVLAPGARVPAVRGATFRLEPGRAAGIAGPSASGKSTLARALAGVWRPAGGSVRLDGAALDQYGAALASHVGYLPQEVVLFDGTVAENIARMDPEAKDADIVAAARRTGGHEMILNLPGGYDFEVSAGGAALSGGQRQRIALARAFYGSPVLVVMDEPDSNLDAEGALALARAIRAHKRRGGADDPACAGQRDGARRCPGHSVRRPATGRRRPGRTGRRLMRKPGQGAGFSARGALALGFAATAILVLGVLGWSVFSSISGAVIAPGRVAVENRNQVVEHIDGGTVSAVHVRDGDRVARGEVLLRFDDAELRSEEALLAGQCAELAARRNRLEAEMRGADAIAWDRKAVAQAAKDPAVRDILAGQERLFRARAAARADEAAGLRERIGQARNEIAGLEAQAASLKEQGTLIARELEAQTGLYEKGLTRLSRVLALQRAAKNLEGQSGTSAAAIARARGRIAELEIRILQIDSRRTEQAAERVRDIGAQENQAKERLASVRERLGRMEVKAPVAGEVFGMTVFAPREVVRPGEPILRIVPRDAGLVVMARLNPIDVDQVYPGQKAMLRFSAFPARETPEFEGRVLRVSADAIRDEGTGLAWYQVELAVDRKAGDASGPRERSADARRRIGDLPVMPGMPVEAHIRTRERSVVSYLVKPVANFFAHALREQ